MARPGWQPLLSTLKALECAVGDILAHQVFAPRQPKPALLRQGTNVTIVQELGGVLISATGGGAAGDSDQVLLPGMAFAAPRSPARAFAGGGLTGTYPNPEVLPERLLGGLLPFLPRQVRMPDLRAGTNITITRDVAGVTISASGGGGGSANVGSTLLDFGAFPGQSDASVTVIGQTNILSGSIVNAWLSPADTADHSADEHILETLKVFAGNIVPGTGFTIYGVNASQLNEPLVPGGAGKAAITTVGAQSSDATPRVGGKGTRISGRWTVAWSWS